MAKTEATVDEARFPELAKLDKFQAESQAIGEFLEWLGAQKINLVQWGKDELWGTEGWIPCQDTHEKLIARYLGIDLKQVERERCILLDELRNLHKAKPRGDA